MSVENEEIQKLDIMPVFMNFLKVLRRFWIVVLAMIVGYSGYYYLQAKRSFRPMYECTATFTVRANYGSDDIFSTSYYDNTAAQQLASAFPYMLNMEIMRDAMSEYLGGSINGSITASSVANTNMFTMKVVSGNPQDAYDVLCAAIDCYPQVAVYMMDNPQVTVQHEPKVPTEPYNSFSGKSAAINGAAKGAAIGFALLLVITLLTRTVSTVDQLKSVGNRPVLAVFPKVNQKKRRSGKQTMVLPDSDPGLAEALEGLALKLKKSLAEEKYKIIAVTSSVSGEGKTTVVTNLARVLAEDGCRVAVVDADLRKQSVAERLGAEPGVMNLLGCIQNDKIRAADQLQYVPDSTLGFLSGNSVRARHYSIDTKGARRVMESLAEEFDYVLVDTPPCGMVADTALLCHFAKYVLYVVKPDTVRESQIMDHVNNLYDRGVPVEGFVFNGLTRKGGNYGYGYRYGYRYGYGSYGKSGYGASKSKNR